MEFQFILEMCIQVVGGLGLFLFGMKQMSEGMQAVAGARIRYLIGKVTNNRILGVGIGASITALIQSSSVTTVMVVGMVNAGLMTLQQSIGVIMGADIGTTITAWLISLKIADFGLPILGLSAFFYLFSKNDKIRYSAMMFLGLGMVFFGLELMKFGFMPLRDNQAFISLLSKFEPDSYFGIIKCVLVGAFVTAIIQSSSATVAITITLARTGVIGYDTAVALVLGENIGTTITAFLASLGTNTNAKRAAYAHITIKVLGVMLMIPVFSLYISFLKFVLSENIDISARIAFAHSFFNILIVCIFISFVTPLARFLSILVPDKKHKQKRHLTYFDVRMLDAPALGVKQSLYEVVRMGEAVQKMNFWLYDFLFKKKDNLKEKLVNRERMLDVMQKEIVEFINKLMSGSLSSDATLEVRKQLRMADEYESISDEIIIIMKLNVKMKKRGLKFSKQDKADIIELHKLVALHVADVSQAVKINNGNFLTKSMNDGKKINHMIKEHRARHLNNLGTKQASPLLSLLYTDMLNSYKRIKDHSINIAEALAGEK
ncbi:Na/Pi cotransporter family protein [candidate division KSB1 bacterium]|nr:Na/Pi cotransporter family protein [candidate division KSB1 bacterium]